MCVAGPYGGIGTGGGPAILVVAASPPMSITTVRGRFLEHSGATTYEDREGVLIVDLAVPSKKGVGAAGDLSWQYLGAEQLGESELVNKGVVKVSSKPIPGEKEVNRIVWVGFVCTIWFICLFCSNEKNQNKRTKPNKRRTAEIEERQKSFETTRAGYVAEIDPGNGDGRHDPGTDGGVRSRGLFLTEFGTEDVALASAGWAARAQDASPCQESGWDGVALKATKSKAGCRPCTSKAAGSGHNTRYGGNGGGNRIGVLPAQAASMCTASARISRSGSACWGTLALHRRMTRAFSAATT